MAYPKNLDTGESNYGYGGIRIYPMTEAIAKHYVPTELAAYTGVSV